MKLRWSPRETEGVLLFFLGWMVMVMAMVLNVRTTTEGETVQFGGLLNNGRTLNN